VSAAVHAGRRAAAAACGQKKAREAVGELIPLLEDPEAPVQQAAHQALRQITGQDFGPEPDASREERRAAVQAWRDWWKKQR
jgi:HEAT repeat protein